MKKHLNQTLMIFVIRVRVKVSEIGTYSCTQFNNNNILLIVHNKVKFSILFWNYEKYCWNLLPLINREKKTRLSRWRKYSWSSRVEFLVEKLNFDPISQWGRTFESSYRSEADDHINKRVDKILICYWTSNTQEQYDPDVLQWSIILIAMLWTTPDTPA